ncbi:hypothetical protein E2C01_055160 [Portunus trituberculatus]|uniref:Uncharacterized protein n=1 Tax=Portunus trituberculatus TaxID=210409 RepID=A0A5B7GV76_PORTR|nr:hypothetical protein [Portunus trituberculatus]
MKEARESDNWQRREHREVTQPSTTDDTLSSPSTSKESSAVEEKGRGRGSSSSSSRLRYTAHCSRSGSPSQILSHGAPARIKATQQGASGLLPAPPFSSPSTLPRAPPHLHTP